MAKDFRRIISSTYVDKKKWGNTPVVDLEGAKVKIIVRIDKNNQICDIQPREFGGVNLFSKYQGRTASWVNELVAEAEALKPLITDADFEK
jgi:hypothetical protein